MQSFDPCYVLKTINQPMFGKKYNYSTHTETLYYDEPKKQSVKADPSQALFGQQWNRRAPKQVFIRSKLS